MFGHFREVQEVQEERERGDCRHRHRHGGFGRWEGFEHGFGGRERFFDAGHLKLVILQLISDKPSYGYEIIKAIEERLAGGYSPSPGVVYPTLTMFEEEGLAAVTSTDGAKKLYAATETGQEYLKTNRAVLNEILGRMEHAGRVWGRGRSPQIQRAIVNLRLALKMRVARGGLNAEQVSKIAEALDKAARAIDEA